MTRKRYHGVNKARRDGWVRQMAEEMPQLTQAEIGQRFGLNQSAVSRIMAKPPTQLEEVGNAVVFPLNPAPDRAG